MGVEGCYQCQEQLNSAIAANTVAMVVCNPTTLVLSPSPMVPLQQAVTPTTITPVTTQFITASPTPAQAPVPPPVSNAQTTITVPVPLPALKTNQAYGMEAKWYGEFLRLFQRFPNRWRFIPSETKPPGDHWEEFRDGAKVRFCCQDCGHGWTSMKGRVMFWFWLDPYSQEGCVIFQLFGQKCLKCNTLKFENPMWYPEEVDKVMTNICNRVGEVYYGVHQFPQWNARRKGCPRNPHNKDLCQACHEGVCNERR